MDYRKNYFKIYFWQSISVLLGFAALFIVVPFISSNKPIFGIYSVCTSLTIFFSYADLGFFSSGAKYAAEYYIRGEHREEIRLLGFTSFIMVSVFAVVALGIIMLGLFPKLLIPELQERGELIEIARWLLFTLAFSCPIIIGQRLLSLIYTIRVEDYKYQRMAIVGNLIRILSVFFFFGDGRYMIVEYYIFYQCVNFAIVLAAFLYARKKYGYGIKDFLSAFHFDREVFDKVKGLTGASLIIMLSSVVYYELDQIVIANLLGIEAVATYAAALSALQLVRSFNSIIFSPYPSRYNHFIGMNNFEGLTHFVKKMIVMFAPILIVPILTFSCLSEPFVLSWVGEQYHESSFLVSFLVLCFIFNFILDPINQYFIATEKNRTLIFYSILLPLVYWVGVFSLISCFGTKSFAVMKFVAPIVNVIAFWMLTSRDFRNRGFTFLSVYDVAKTVIPTVLTVVFFTWVFSHWMIEEYSKMALLINISLMIASILLSMALAIPFNKELRFEIKRFISTIK